jgi:signal transduction histidine kinase
MSGGQLLHPIHEMLSAEVVLSQLPTACVRVDATGVIRWANGRAVAVLGDIVDHRVEQVLAPMEVLLETARAAGRSELRRRGGGGEQELGYQVAQVDGELIIVFQNITGFQHLRAERDRLMQIAAVGDVLPSVLHELKNPLAAVRTAVEVLIEEHPTGELAEQLHAVLNEIRRMGLVLDGIGRMKHELPSQRDFPIDQSVREAFAVLVPQASGRGVKTTANIETLPLLPFDASAMRAIVFNLVTNAIHACRAGDTIALELKLDAGALVLTIRDTGSGMTPEVKQRCTELFFTTKARGSGIGLALVQDLTRSANGTLQIDSEPGRGTAISLRLPLSRQG